MKIPRRLLRIGIFAVSRKYTSGTLIVWRDQDDVLLVRQRQGEALWGFPGGILEGNEDFPAAAQRELQQECGISIGDKLSLEVRGAHVQDWARHVETVFRVVGDSRERPVLTVSDSFEVAEAAWHPVDALPQLRREAKFVLERYPDILA